MKKFRGPFLRLFPLPCYILQEMLNQTCKPVKTKNKFPSTNAPLPGHFGGGGGGGGIYLLGVIIGAS